LEAGILFSLALALLIDPDPHQRATYILRAILVAAISHPVIIMSRVIYRCIEELALWIRRQSDTAGASERVLLYGAGARGQLFLKDSAAANAKTPDRRFIVGFIDDEFALHFQWIYGQLVLGGMKELPHLITKFKVNRVIVVADLLPDSWKAIREIAMREGIHLSEWFPQEHEIRLTTPQKKDIVEPLHKSS
jgi:FlaA1/EpsC-like NDP-sugar epimerase